MVLISFSSLFSGTKSELFAFQGVLQLGPPRAAFGSRIPDKEETRICAPVTIGKSFVFFGNLSVRLQLFIKNSFGEIFRQPPYLKLYKGIFQANFNFWKLFTCTINDFLGTFILIITWELLRTIYI